LKRGDGLPRSGRDLPKKKSKAALEETDAAVDSFKEGLDQIEATDLKANPEESEAAVDYFKEGLDQVEATGLVANPEESEAAVERQELRNKIRK
jgi:hypothetical protein